MALSRYGGCFYRVMIYLERSKINQQARVALCYTWGSYLFSTVISKLARHIYLFLLLFFYFFMTDAFTDALMG